MLLGWSIICCRGVPLDVNPHELTQHQRRRFVLRPADFKEFLAESMRQGVRVLLPVIGYVHYETKTVQALVEILNPSKSGLTECRHKIVRNVIGNTEPQKMPRPRHCDITNAKFLVVGWV